jgi:hypothetical protein
LLIVPTGGISVHVTAGFDAPLIRGVNVVLWPSLSVTLWGDKLRFTAVSVTVAVAVLVESKTLAAVIVTV